MTESVGVAGPAASLGKRTLDVLAACLVMLFFAPIGVVVVAAIRMSRDGPILTREETIGLHGRSFGRWRFHRPSERETVFDYMLWRAGLMETPSVMNVIEGEMSLVGPQPHTPGRYARLRHGGRDYARRFEARPGLIWPVAADGEPSLNAELDYVSGWSGARDLGIVARHAVRDLFREERS